MRFLLLIPFLVFPLAALAQDDNSMLVVGGAKDPRPASEIEHERVVQQFPDWAVTRAGAAAGGHDQDVPATPSAPAAPSATAPQSAPTPAIPAAPASPASKLWPADTVPIFMKSCVSYQPKLVVPCSCVIRKLMVAMPHDEFLKLTAEGTVEADARLQNIRVECAVNAAADQ